MTAAESLWEQRAATLHAAMLNSADPGVHLHKGRYGRLWHGSREALIRHLWPDVQGRSRTHPYGGTLSRLLAGAVVKIGQSDGGESVWWVAAERTGSEVDPKQCPDCGGRFRSAQARRGHQASHRQGRRRAYTDADVEALAETLAPRLARLLADLSPEGSGP